MDRVSTARAVLHERKRQVIADAISPCVGCQFYELVCLHPSVAIVSSDRVTGKSRIEGVSAREARLETGLCGPEGALYSERSPAGKLWMTMLTTKGGQIALGGGFLLVLGLISG